MIDLITDYDLEVFTPPCHLGAETWSAVAHFEVDISPALPYLNATLRGAVYNQAAQALTWKKGGRNVAFHAHKIAAGHLDDRAEADKVIRGLVKMVNQTVVPTIRVTRSASGTYASTILGRQADRHVRKLRCPTPDGPRDTGHLIPWAVLSRPHSLPNRAASGTISPPRKPTGTAPPGREEMQR